METWLETEYCDRAQPAVTPEAFGRHSARIGEVGTNEVRDLPPLNWAPAKAAW